MVRATQQTLHRNLLDSIAITVSFACLVHCLALPVLVALLPVWSAWLDVPEAFHVWVLAFAAPFSLTVLIRAAKGRARFVPLWMGVAGLAIMTLGLIVREAFEPPVTSLGAGLLAWAHIRNWRERARCVLCGHA